MAHRLVDYQLTMTATSQPWLTGGLTVPSIAVAVDRTVVWLWKCKKSCRLCEKYLVKKNNVSLRKYREFLIEYLVRNVYKG